MGLRTEGLGRPVEYNPEWDIRALMLRQVEQIPYVKDLVRRLRRNRYLQQVCGYQDKVPTPALGEETRLMEGRLRVISSFSGISSRKQLEKG